MKDYLIIGHGIAGAVLTHKLLEHDVSITVIDNPKNNHSSSVAGGLYNPITGRKMVKTWLADHIFPIIEATYSRLEKKLKCSFLHPIGIYRPFISVEEQNDWLGKSADKNFNQFIKRISKQSTSAVAINDPYGGIHLDLAGYVDVPELINASRKHLLQLESYIEADFDEQELDIKENHIVYNKETYSRLIFCNGIKSQESTLFNWMPLKPAKGEILHGDMNKKIETIYNRGVFMLPKHDCTVRIGSNYQNHFDNLETTTKAKNEILDKLNKLTSEPVKITSAIAGIRPATKDRRPIIGKHPNYRHIYMFNGFGSKGVSLIPYFSEDLVSHLMTNSDLHTDVNISRYYKLYKEN